MHEAVLARLVSAYVSWRLESVSTRPRLEAQGTGYRGGRVEQSLTATRRGLSMKQDPARFEVTLGWDSKPPPSLHSATSISPCERRSRVHTHVSPIIHARQSFELRRRPSRTESLNSKCDTESKRHHSGASKP